MVYKLNKKGDPVVFRRWNNKRFAAFNSLKRIIKIGCLLVIYLRFANPGALAATIDTTKVVKNLELEPIEINSERPPETFSSQNRVVVVVSKKEIEQAAVNSINELLEFASNIDVRQRGTEGVQSDLSIRGCTFDQVLILLNGINITDPQTGHHNLDLPLDLSVIERIEVVKGPGSWKYGPGAFGGVVNFITKNSALPFLRAGLEGGQYTYHKEILSGGFSTGAINHYLSANNSSSKGYKENTDFNVSNLFYQGRIATDHSELSLQVGYTDKNYGANSFYSAKYPNQFEATQTLFSSFKVKTTAGKLHVEPSVYFRRNNDKFLLFRNNPSLNSNYHTTDVWGSNLSINYFHTQSSITSFGFETRTETIWSNRLGELSNQQVNSPLNDTIKLNYFHSRTNFSSFIGHKHYFSNLLLNIGMNFTRNTDQNFKWYIYPGIDISYCFLTNSSIFASINKTMRMPTFTDLYYSGPVNEGNPHLLPEEAIGYEIGYQFRNEYFQISSTIFYSKGENLIDWVKLDISDIWHTINHSEINTEGAELSVLASLNQLLPKQKYLEKLKIDYTYVHQDKPITNLISNYSLNYLKHRFDLTLIHSIMKNIDADWHLTYQYRNGLYEKYTDNVSQGLVRYQPFLLCDLKISWRNSGWSVFGTINNLFDNRYYDIGNIVQPGRWFKIGVTKNINFK
jgi:vitamin B12 transporter